MCTSLGWSWEAAREQLDIPRIKALNAYWREHPPVHLLVASYLGYKVGAASEQDSAPALETGDIMDMLIKPEESHG